MNRRSTPTETLNMDRTIPFSHDAEANILSAILTNNELMMRLNFLNPDDFHGPAMRDIFTAMRACESSGSAITPFTIPAHIADIEVFKMAGGVQRYLAQLLAHGNTVIQPVEYARYVHELAQKRRLLETCEDIIGAIGRENDDLTSDQHAMALRDALERIEKTGQIEMFVDNHKITQSIMEKLKTAAMPFSTGIDSLDSAMDGGLHPGKLYGFAARKKIGKTALAATISANLNDNKVRHLFIAAEMTPEEIHQRVLSRYTNTFASAFRSDYGRSDDFSLKVANALLKMPKCTFYHKAPGISFGMLKRAISKAVNMKKCKGFILDYLQIVHGKQKGQTKAEHLDEVSQWLADFCHENGCFGIIMAQINQDGNTRDGEGIRIAADMVFQMHREDITMPQTWLEMLDTRYTAWANVGSKETPGLIMEEKGPWFHEPMPAQR